MASIHVPGQQETVIDDGGQYWPCNVQVLFDHYCPECKRNLCIVTYQNNVLTSMDFVKPQYYADIAEGGGEDESEDYVQVEHVHYDLPNNRFLIMCSAHP